MLQDLRVWTSGRVGSPRWLVRAHSGVVACGAGPLILSPPPKVRWSPGGRLRGRVYDFKLRVLHSQTALGGGNSRSVYSGVEFLGQ